MPQEVHSCMITVFIEAWPHPSSSHHIYIYINPRNLSFFTNLASCPAALAVSQAKFVEEGGNDGFCGFRGKCGLFCLYRVSRSFCKQLGPLRAFGFVVVLLFCASFIYCITEMGWNTDLLIKGLFSCFLFCIHPVFVCNDST